MNYKSLITDLHVNLHPDQIDLIDKWYEHAKSTLDFFTLAYYPYQMVDMPGGMRTEDVLPREEMDAQWKTLTEYFQKREQDGDYAAFIGYEWQGACLDGDHNVYFRNYGPIQNPLRYETLIEELSGYDAIGIPHHLAYQLGHRGKNWSTHNEKFSPFAEIFSSHGSSEAADTDIPMTRHIHMGPRTGGTSVMDGLKKGHHVGIIASGDNHVVPGMVNHGRAGIWAEDNTKEAIWDAFNARRVFGFNKNRINVWTELDGAPMGEIVTKNNQVHTYKVDVTANNRIDRIELLKDGEVSQVHTNIFDNSIESNDEVVTFKFKVECGWGPDLKQYPDFESKLWQGTLETVGVIESIEKDYNSFDVTYTIETKEKASFECTSHKTTQSGRWMGNSPVNTEGFIFEITAPRNSEIVLKMNGRETVYTVQDILDNTDLIVFLEDSEKLAAERFNFTSYYRSDPFYHNAYKVRVNRGAEMKDYHVSCAFDVKEETGNHFYQVKVHQKDGQIAWSSPTWLED